MTASLALVTRPTSRQLLARILDTPDLAAQIHALAPSALAKLIDRLGLEDAGEIVAFATTDQLAQVFDDDLWRSERPGEDERFDAARFVVWLEVMLEAGDAFVAQRLSELPRDLVTLAFHRQVLVFDLAALMEELGREDANAAEKALSDCLSEELEDFQIVSRHHDGWDAVLAALLALDRDHHALLVGILERCAAMSADAIDDAGGLYEVLTSEEMLEGDVYADREDRRAEAGHVAPSSAAAFLKLARAPTETSGTERDPVTRAWFRDLARTTTIAAAANGARPAAPDLLAFLRGSGVLESATPRLLTAGDGAAQPPLVIRAMRQLADEGHPSFSARSEEIAYLANVLAAGCPFQGRRMRPIEATRAAIATTSLGLELRTTASRRDPVAAAARVLREHSADALFRGAWSTIHRDVVVPAAAAAEKRRERAPDVDDALRGLIDECPTLRGALADHRSEGRAGDPRFLTTAVDLARVRALLRSV